MKHLFRHWRTSGAVIGSLLKKGSIAVLALLVVFLAGRIYESQRGPALHRWHTWSSNEMSAEEIDQATFAQYLAAFIVTAGSGRGSLSRTGTVLLC